MRLRQHGPRPLLSFLRPGGISFILAFVLLTHGQPANAEDELDCSFCGEGRSVDNPTEEVTVDLGILPTLTNGTCQFFDVAFPLLENCPSVPESTRVTCCSGTGAPSSSPSFSPTGNPTTVPPTPVPTNEPTQSPVPPTPVPTKDPFVIGEELCGCQPSIYEFQFNFSSPCPADNDAFGPAGIAEQSCQVTSTSSDSVLVVVKEVVIEETGQSGSELRNALLTGPFQQEDVIAFESAMRVVSGLAEPPKQLGMFIQGENKDGIEVRAEWSVVFTNECDVFPVIRQFDTTVGVFVKDVTDPPLSFCPAAETTDAPTMAPSQRKAPTATPTKNDAPSPLTAKPTMKPTHRYEETHAPSCPPVGFYGKKEKGKKESDKDDDHDYQSPKRGKKSSKGDSDYSKSKGKGYMHSKGDRDDSSSGKKYMYSGDKSDKSYRSKSSKEKGKRNRDLLMELATDQTSERKGEYSSSGNELRNLYWYSPSLCPGGDGGKGLGHDDYSGKKLKKVGKKEKQYDDEIYVKKKKAKKRIDKLEKSSHD